MSRAAQAPAAPRWRWREVQSATRLEPRPELWLRPHDGHVSILNACPLAMEWLEAQLEGQAV